MSTRRETLDSYGQLAQLFTLALILFAAAWRQVKSRTTNPQQTSPRGKSTTFLGEPLPSILLVSQWIAFLLLLGVFYLPSTSAASADLKTDYIYYTRLPVQLLTSLLPFHVLFSNSSKLNPLPWLLNVPRTTLVSYHRTLGWVFMFLAAVHGSMYMNFYIQRGLLLKRIQDIDVQLGVCLILAFSGVAFASRKSFRASVGRNWVWKHIPAVLITAGLLWNHVVQTRVYIKQAAAVSIVGIVWRAVKAFNAQSRAAK